LDNELAAGLRRYNRKIRFEGIEGYQIITGDLDKP